MESLDALEKRRIADLIKQGKDGAESGSTMEWMYSDKKTNTDDYLLGKKIDKHFEQGDQTPPKEDDIFGERIKANIALDMQAKMREDPLYAIKKREEESRRKILHNPVKMKELQKLIAEQKKEKNKKAKKKHKHAGLNDDDDLVQQYLSILTQKHGQHKGNDRRVSKTHRKGGRHRSASTDSSENRHRQQSKTHRKGGRHRSASRDSSENRHRQQSKTHRKGGRHCSASSDSSENRHRQQSKTHRKGGRHRSASSDSSENRHRQQSKTHRKGGRHRSASSDSSENRHRQQSKTHRKGGRHRSASIDSSENRHRQQSKTHRKGGRHHPAKGARMSHSPAPTIDPTQKRYGLIKSSRHQSRSKSRSRSPKVAKTKSSLSPSRHPSSHKSRSPHSSRLQQYRERSRSPHRKGHQGRKWSPPPPKRKVDGEERERRIQEMMDNAKWREEQRETLQRGRSEGGRAEEEQRKQCRFPQPSDVPACHQQHSGRSTQEEQVQHSED